MICFSTRGARRPARQSDRGSLSLCEYCLSATGRSPAVARKENRSARAFSTTNGMRASQIAALLRQRHSTRNFDDEHPITATELSCFLEGTARVLSTSRPESWAIQRLRRKAISIGWRLL